MDNLLGVEGVRPVALMARFGRMSTLALVGSWHSVWSDVESGRPGGLQGVDSQASRSTTVEVEVFP